jgi:hypothetical protein
VVAAAGYGYRLDAGCADRSPLRLDVGFRDLAPLRHRSAVLLIAWVAAIAVIRGVNNIVFAFRVREVQHAV